MTYKQHDDKLTVSISGKDKVFTIADLKEGENKCFTIQYTSENAYQIFLDKQGGVCTLKIREKAGILNKNELSVREKTFLDKMKSSIQETHKDGDYDISKRKLISDKKYNERFSKESFSQGSIGNCYLIAGFFAMKELSSFDTLIKGSVSIGEVKKKGADKGENCVIVKMPLGEPGGTDVYISGKELGDAKLNGAIGFKALELAYLKFHHNNKNKRYPNEIKESDYKTIKGGSAANSYETMLGQENVNVFELEDSALNKMNNKKKGFVFDMLTNFLPKKGVSILVSSLKGKNSDSDSNVYKVGSDNNRFLAHKHAYAIKNVEKSKDGKISSITVQNPWNGNETGDNQYKDEITMNYDEFLKSFRRIQYCTTNRNFLDGETNHHKEVTVVKKDSTRVSGRNT